MNKNLAIIGMQWGDEGKGKIVDLLAPTYDIVVRFQGGNNAGHTIKVNDKQVILHTIPSGALHPKVENVIGNGVVVNPEALIEELDLLKEHGIDVEGRLFLSDRSHLIMPSHLFRDKSSEEVLGTKKIGTTSKGIGPAYGDKAQRRGVRAGYLLTDEADNVLIETIKSNLNRMDKLYDCKDSLNIDSIMESVDKWKKRLSPIITDTRQYLFNSIKAGKSVLFEGAQGTMLDIDHGTYPYVTSSNSSALGIPGGTGLSPKQIGKVLGIIKAYTTRVGEGPFITELHDKDGELLRDKGCEFGSTTGRPRRCGWFDMVVAKYAVQMNGVDCIALTKLDVLDSFPKIKVCTKYKMNGKETDTIPSNIMDYDKMEPVYVEFDGWQESSQGIDNFDDLPENAKKYITFLEENMECPVSIISTGANRRETIFKNKEVFK